MAHSSARFPWCRPWWAHVAAALVVATLTVGLWRAEKRVGVTVDEYGHLIRGLAIGWAPDTRLNWPHPPLPHVVVALPTLLRGPRVDFTELPGWRDGDFTKTVKGYWRTVGYANARRQLVAGRHMMIGLAGAVAAWLWWWAQRRMGKTIGMVTLLLWCSHTTLLAHAQLITNDFAAACCSLFLAATLVDHLRRPTWKRLAFFALACGASVVTKTSLVAMAVLSATLLFAGAAAGLGGFRRMPIPRRLGRGLRDAVLAGAFSWFAVCALYKFDRVFLTVAEFNAQTEPSTTYARKKKAPIATIAHVPGGIVPLPYTYVFGIQFVRAQNEDGHTGWFMGKPNPEGDPAYFTTLARVKTPLGLAALAAAGLAGAALRRRRTALLVPIAVTLSLAYFFIASRARINLGFRHAAPTIPWLVLIGARGAADLWRGHWQRVPRRAVVVACTAASVLGAVSVHPLYLGDFNLLGGGRKGGLSINLAEEDWGQDTPDLALLVKEENLQPLHYFSRFSTMGQELRTFGVSYDGLSCGKRAEGWVVIGIKDYTERQKCFRWLGDLEPTHVVNDHLLVFHVEKGAPAKAKPDEPATPDEPTDEE